MPVMHENAPVDSTEDVSRETYGAKSALADGASGMQPDGLASTFRKSDVPAASGRKPIWSIIAVMLAFVLGRTLAVRLKGLDGQAGLQQVVGDSTSGQSAAIKSEPQSSTSKSPKAFAAATAAGDTLAEQQRRAFIPSAHLRKIPDSYVPVLIADSDLHGELNGGAVELFGGYLPKQLSKKEFDGAVDFGVYQHACADGSSWKSEPVVETAERLTGRGGCFTKRLEGFTQGEMVVVIYNKKTGSVLQGVVSGDSAASK
jgi:hypothetical protein